MNNKVQYLKAMGIESSSCWKLTNLFNATKFLFKVTPRYGTKYIGFEFQDNESLFIWIRIKEMSREETEVINVEFIGLLRGHLTGSTYSRTMMMTADNLAICRRTVGYLWEKALKDCKVDLQSSTVCTLQLAIANSWYSKKKK